MTYLANVGLAAWMAIVCLSGAASAQQSPTTPLTEPTVSQALERTLGQRRESGPGDRRGAATDAAAESRRGAVGARATVRTITSPARGARGVAGKEAFQPLQGRPLEYTDVPDVGEVITLDAADRPLPVIEFLDALARATGWNIVSSQGLEEKTVRFWVKEIRPRDAMEVLRFHGIYYEFNPETKFLYVMTQEEFLSRQYGAIHKQEFDIKHADAVDMETILTSLLSPNGRIVSNPRSGSLIVWDTEANLAEMRAAVKQFDVPLEPRVFALKHLQADLVLESVATMLSERGSVTADSRVNALVVNDLPSRQEQVARVLEMLDRELETKTWTLNYADVEAVAERLQSIVPEEMGAITWDEDSHQVSVTAIPERLAEIDKLMKAWDIKPKQVQIEAYLVSAGTEVTRDLGINWTYFDEKAGTPISILSGGTTRSIFDEDGNLVLRDDQNNPIAQRAMIGTLPYRVPLRNPATSEIIRDAYGNIVFDPEYKGNRISALLDFLERKGEVKILSRPRVTVRDGQEAKFESTTDEPYQEGGYSQYGVADTDNPNYNRVIPLRVNFITWGTILTVKPRINEEGNILMEIEAEDSTADTANVEVGDQQSTIPRKQQNRTETQVLVNNGQTIVIGGLRSARLEDNVDKVPILGEVPVVGRLFRSTRKGHRDRELMVFLTPSIVAEYTQPEAERLADFEEAASKRLRITAKPFLMRVEDKLRRGKQEINVSIGQSGEMHSEGEPVTLDDLKAVFDAVKFPSLKKVIIRQHPDAPPDVAKSVCEAVGEAGLSVQFDEGAYPFVPSSPPK